MSVTGQATARRAALRPLLVADSRGGHITLEVAAQALLIAARLPGEQP